MKYTGLIIMLILLACGVSHPLQTNISSVNEMPLTLPSPSQVDDSSLQRNPIRRINFNDFSYDWYPKWADTPSTGRKIVLKDSSMILGSNHGKEPREFFLIDDGVKYGDLTGDGSEEAVVILGVITSGTFRPNLIFVYTMAHNGPKRLWVYETGDRSDYGYRGASIKDGQLIIEQYKPTIIEYQGQKHDMSRSDFYIRNYYKWDGAYFKKVKTEELPTDASDIVPWVYQQGR